MKITKKNHCFLLFLFIFLFGSFSVTGQNLNIDSLKHLLQKNIQDSVKIKIYFNLSTHHFNDDILKSEAYLDTVFKLAKKNDYQDILAKIQFYYGNINFRKGQLNKSLMFFLDYLKTQEVINNRKGMANAFAGIGNVLYTQANLDEALEYYQKALQIYKEFKDDSLLQSNSSSVINNIANIYDIRNEDQKALEWYKESYKVAVTTNNYASLGNTCNNIGELYLELGNDDSAYFYIQKSLEVRLKSSDDVGISKSYKNFGAYYIKQKNYTIAVEYLQKALQITNKTHEWIIVSEIQQLLATAFENMGDSRSALESYKSYKRANDSLFNEKLTRELTKQQMQFEYEKKEKQFQLEQQEREFRFLLIAIALSLLLIILGLLYLLRGSKIKRNKLARENLKLEKKSLEKELEIRNKELATSVMYLVKKNEFLNYISKKLLELKGKLKDENKPFTQKIIFDIQKSMDNTVWEEFEIRFQQVHSKFYKNLQAKFPDLSPNEKKLCAFLRLNMNTKEIAALLHRNEKSIAVARSRLRKKLNLTNTDIDLVQFLANL